MSIPDDPRELVYYIPIIGFGMFMIGSLIGTAQLTGMVVFWVGLYITKYV